MGFKASTIDTGAVRVMPSTLLVGPVFFAFAINQTTHDKHPYRGWEYLVVKPMLLIGFCYRSFIDAIPSSSELEA